MFSPSTKSSAGISLVATPSTNSTSYDLPLTSIVTVPVAFGTVTVTAPSVPIHPPTASTVMLAFAGRLFSIMLLSPLSIAAAPSPFNS